MNEHALELLHAALWVISGIGGIGIGTLVWGGRQVLRRLSGAEKALGEIKDLLRDEIHAIDNRLSVVETVVGIVNPNSTQPGYRGQQYKRRFSDAVDDSKGD